MSLTRLRLPPALVKTLRSQSIRAMGIGESHMRERMGEIGAGLERGKRERERK